MKKRKIKKNFLKSNYSKSWNYIKDSRNFIFTIIGIFFLFLIIGFFMYTPENVVQKILELIRELLEKTEGMGFLELFWFIFFNNFKVSLFGMIGGIFFGILPVLESVINGYLLGFVAEKTVALDGIFSLWKILPHGIFELPAVFISLGLGVRLGFVIFKKKGQRNFKETFVELFRIFVFVVVPLLILAAIIESWLIVLAK